MSWRSEKVDSVESWVLQYAGRRYGKWNYPETVRTAWLQLLQGAYQYHWGWGIKSIVDRGPELVMSTDFRFNATEIASAWQFLVKAATSKQLDPSIGPLRYDIVDIGRQTLVNTFVDLHSMYLLAYMKFAVQHVNSSQELTAISSAMIQLLTDLDDLLASDTNFLLGHWILDARNSAPSSSPQSVTDNLEFNARNQITMWGPHQNIEDYAGKEWAGLVKDYYLQRWGLLTSLVNGAVQSGKQFNSTQYEAARFKLEQKFSYEIKSYPTQPQGDTIQESNKILENYFRSSSYINEHFSVVQNMDIPGNDLFGVGKGPWSRLLAQVAWICEVNPTCVGFNSNGWVKNSTSVKTSSPGTVLYLKK